jgi:hypothetical protein
MKKIKSILKTPETKCERVSRHHSIVFFGLCGVAFIHVFSPELKGPIELLVALYWSSDPSLE